MPDIVYYSGQEFTKNSLYDLNGNEFLRVGLASSFPYENVVIKTGKHLDNDKIELKSKYKKCGIASCINKPVKDKLLVYGVRYTTEDVVSTLEKVRDGIEKILKDSGKTKLEQKDLKTN